MKLAYVLAMCVAAVTAQDPTRPATPPTTTTRPVLISMPAPVTEETTTSSTVECSDCAANSGPIRCFTGTQSYLGNTVGDGDLVYNTAFPSLCRPDQRHCSTFYYTLQAQWDDGMGGVVYYNVTSRYGECTADVTAATCDSFVEYVKDYGKVLSCDVRSCDGDPNAAACNNDFDLTAGPFCKPSTDILDPQLWPNCTLQQSISGVVECLIPVFTQYPYDNTDVCGANWNKAIGCLAALVPTCLDSHCPTVLDAFPGLRSEYSTATSFALSIKDVTSLGELIAQLTGVNILPTIAEFACPSGADIVTIETLLDVLQTTLDVVDLDGLLQALPFDFPCPGLLGNVQQAGFQFIREFYEAESQEEIAEAAARFGQRVLAIFAGCDFSPLWSQVSYLLMDAGIDVPESTIGFFLNWFLNWLPDIFPMVPTVPPTVTPTPTAGPTPDPTGTCPQPGRPINLGCSRFYDSESVCGQRRAWLCDYADWKLHFLRGWVRDFQQITGEDYSAWIPECPDNTGVQCRASQRCCVRSAGGCELCYCQGHDYTDASGVLDWWRRDYRAWTRFFQAYQQLVASGGFPNPADTC